MTNQKAMKMNQDIKKIAIKAGEADSVVFETLVEKDTSAKKLLVEPGLAAYQLSDGLLLEIYGAGGCYPDYLFSHGNVVLTFRVDRLEEKVHELIEAGASLFGQIVLVNPSYRYCHLLTHGETVIGLYEES